MAEKKRVASKTGGAGRSDKSKPASSPARGGVSKVKPPVKKNAAKAKPAVKKNAATPAVGKSAVKAGPVVRKDTAKAKTGTRVAKVRQAVKTPVRNVVSKEKPAAVPAPPEQPRKSRSVTTPAPSTPVEPQVPKAAHRAEEDSADSGPATPRDHAGIAKGIAERKAAAKAKSIARRSRPAVEKNKNLKKLTDKQSKEYEAMLLRLRDEISRQIAFLRGASLTRSDEVNPEEDGSDAFERQLALKLASNEGDAVFEIDEALQRIKEDSYGICQDCGCIISPARLKALPFARRCVACKAVAEKNRDVNERRYF